MSQPVPEADFFQPVEFPVDPWMKKCSELESQLAALKAENERLRKTGNGLNYFGMSVVQFETASAEWEQAIASARQGRP